MIEADRIAVTWLKDLLPIKKKVGGVLTDEEKGKLFMELMEKRRKHFAVLRAQEKRNNLLPKAQEERTQKSTYLDHMNGYTLIQIEKTNKKKIEGRVETAKGTEIRCWKEKSRKRQTAKSTKKQKNGKVETKMLI
ncbi:hypothetical protein Tco_0251524 [Tanacetum coccineum]